MLKILVTGANGQLGSEIRELISDLTEYEFIFTDLPDLDITDHGGVEQFVDEKHIDLIINCAAYTAVDRAEEESELADKINHLAARNLARIAKKRNIKLVHISTDYVFDGHSWLPYKETDSPNPQCVYGKTKLDGENAIREINPLNSIIIRTSWLYSRFGNNFVKTMLRLGKERDELGVVYDQIGSPTYDRDLAKAILDILPKLKNNGVEVYHYANEGICSWYDFAKAIFEMTDLHIKVNAIETWQYPLPARRPFYSCFNKNKIIKTYDLEIPYWKTSLALSLRKMI